MSINFIKQKEASDIPFIYFMSMVKDGERIIRIGHTYKEDRIKTHEANGYKLEAIVTGTRDNEERLHFYFKEALRSDFGSSKSNYNAEAVQPYINELLRWHHATRELRLRWLLARAKFNDWCPETLLKNKRSSSEFFPSSDSKTKARNTWQSPIWMFKCAKEAMGSIALDPCSELEAYLRPPPELRPDYFYTEYVNGLTLPWLKTVYCNPPYDIRKKDEEENENRQGVEASAQDFAKKLRQEVKLGNVEQAIMILNLQSVPTLWFPKLLSLEPVFAITRKRVDFFGPLPKSGKGTRWAASKNGTIILYYGPNKTKFFKAFSDYAYPIEFKYEYMK